MSRFWKCAQSMSILLLLGCMTVSASTLGAARQELSKSDPAAVCHKSIPEIYDEESPAVVYINTQTIRPYQFTERVRQGVASGFLIRPNGLILTNFHVVSQVHAIQVTLDNGDVYPATVVGADPLFDLAVLRITVPAGEKLPTIAFGDSAALHIGDEVIAIGNPLGLDQTLTHGVVSGLNRELLDTPLSLAPKMIQTDAAINPGNSGGPLLNRCGQVVGINTAVIDSSEGLGFAIPINLAKAVLPSLLLKGRVVRPWIGFHGEMVDRAVAPFLGVKHAPGLLIEAVEPGSPAAKAGLRGGSLDIAIAGYEYLVGGDFVTAINGVHLDSDESLEKVMRTLQVGKEIRVKLYRKGVIRSLSYRLPERPPLSVAPVPAQ